MKRLACLLSVLLGASALSVAPSRGQSAQAPQRVRLAPQYAPGTVLRYQLEFRTTTDVQHSGLVVDPQAPSLTEIAWDAVVRVEVLGTDPGTSGPAASSTAAAQRTSDTGTMRPARLRATYEKSVATIRSDSFDPAAAAIEEQYRKLQGRTIQFTFDAGGRVTGVEGLEEIAGDEKGMNAVREWLAQLAGSAQTPAEGIVAGQKWTSELPVTSAPLLGLLWRTESTYLRDEPCRKPPEAPSGASAAEGTATGETCAVILTRYEMAELRSHGDRTPEDYRQHGLRTSGKWSGSAESLSYVSLRTGWVVSVTQSGTEEMDITVSTADGESHLRYAGRVRSQSHVSLLPDSPPAPR